MNVLPADEKAVLRERFRAARLALSEEEVALRSAAICRRLADLPEIESARTVHVYWPLLHRHEVDTRPLIRQLHGDRKRIVLPVVDVASGTRRLRHVEFGGENALRASRWGVLEPDGPEVPPEEIDAVVVPAFGAGRNGHRIGHGWGFYDAFLTGLNAPALGAVYSTCLVENITPEPHDVPLHVIVTEYETLRPLSR